MSRITIGTNISSLTAQRRLSDSTGRLQNVFERLASGRRINSASDDAAGLAIASSLNFSSRVYAKAINNINDGMSALSIASGALSSLSGVVQRQMELAEQAANGTYSRTQRLSLQQEANALSNEFNRVVETASFNGIKLLSNSSDLRLQLGYGDNSYLDIALGKKLGRAISTGSYTSLSGASYGLSAQDTVTADLDGDGNLDIIASTNGGTVGVRYGNGDGTFRASSTITTGGARYVQVGDVDGDGRMDIIHGNSAGFTVTRQTSTGVFASAVTYTSSNSGVFNNGRSGTLQDINGDGRLDLVQTYITSGQAGVEVFLGNGDGSFYSSATFRTATGGTGGVSGAASIGDINGDGKADFIMSGNFGNGNSVYAFYGNGDGTFSAPTSLGGLIGINNVSLADINNDGFLDVVQSAGGGGVISLLGNGNGTFNARQTYSDIAANILSTGMSIVDLNKDGFADVIGISYTTGNIVTYFGNGDGSFKASVSSNIGGINSLGFGLGDLNGDGVEDVVTSFGGNTLSFTSDTTQSANVGQVYLATQEGARRSLDSLRTIFERIQQETSSLGSSLSRLSFGLNAIAARREGELASYSRIVDADIGEESSELTRLKILQQVSSAVLAQANLQPQIALKLLQG